MRFPFRLRKISAALVLLLLVACSRAVDVPFEPLDGGSRAVEGQHRIRMANGEAYVVERYTIADSTLTIGEVSPSDKTHRHVDAPVSFPLSAVESIHRIERHVPLYVAIGGVVLFIGAIALVTGGDAFTD